MDPSTHAVKHQDPTLFCVHIWHQGGGTDGQCVLHVQLYESIRCRVGEPIVIEEQEAL